MIRGGKESVFISELGERRRAVGSITLDEAYEWMERWDDMDGCYSSFEVDDEEVHYLEDLDVIPDEIKVIFWSAEGLDAVDVMERYLDGDCFDKMDNIPKHVMDQLQDALDEATRLAIRWDMAAAIMVKITDKDREEHTHDD